MRVRAVVAAGAVAVGALVVFAERAADLDALAAGGDVAAGVALLAAGLLAWHRRRANRTGLLLGAAALAWFVGDLAPALVYAHRGPLIHALLTYPRGRLGGWPARAVVAAAYLDGLVLPFGRSATATVVVMVAAVAVATGRFATAGGPERQARGAALAAVTAVAAVLVPASIVRLAGAPDDRLALLAYDAVLVLVAAGVALDLRPTRRTTATVTGLVVDLGELDRPEPLRARLARAIGDTGLVLGYRIVGGAYVDDDGRAVVLPQDGADGRTVTFVTDGDEPIAALVHDTATLDDPDLARAVASAARLAVVNARLEAEVRARVRDIDRSRRRIVVAAAEQRRRLQRELADGGERRLDAAARLLDALAREPDAPARGGQSAAVRESLRPLVAALDAARGELRRFGRGLHPAVLTADGLDRALADLAAASAVPVTLHVGGTGRLPPEVEAAAFFLCAEALTNVAKYARASRAEIHVARPAGRVEVTIADDGIGGADIDLGSGVRGLTDRIEALGGRLRLVSPPGRGTRIEATIPATATVAAGVPEAVAP